MANSFITLNLGTGGPKMDTELLTVAAQLVHRERNQVAGVNDNDIASVNDVAPVQTEHGLSTRKLVNRSTVQTFQSAVVLNVTTFNNSSNFDSSPYRAALVFVDAVISAGTPTELRLRAQFSDDAGTTWHNYEDDGWGEMTWTAGFPILQARRLPEIGRLIRFRIEGTGTDGSNTFTVTITAEFIS